MDLSPRYTSKGLRKRTPEDEHKQVAGAAERGRLRTCGSPGGNLIFLIFSLYKFLQATDILIVLDNDESAINLNEPAAPCSSEREQEPRQVFNDRIPLSFSGPEQIDATHTDSKNR